MGWENLPSSTAKAIATVPDVVSLPEGVPEGSIRYVEFNETLYTYDGSVWAAVAGGGGGSGTVTSVSVVTAHGVSGTVATATTTPAITLTLGAITPTTVVASGAVSGSNLSGTNTGDQTIALTGDVTGTGTGSFAATIAAGAVTNAKIVAAAGISVNKLAALTASKAVASDSSGFLVSSATSATELGFVAGVTSAIQTQLNTKGPGDVVGPGSATDTAIVKFNSTTGKLVQNSGVTISSSNVVTSSGQVVNALTSGKGIVVKANATTPGNLQEWQNSSGTALSVVDASGHVGIGATSPATNLEVNGALRLSGTGVDSFVTPTTATANTKINIPLYDPGAFSQVMSMGIPSTTASTSSRVLALYDARTIPHQPSLMLFSPGENDAMGFSWDGTDTVAYLKCSKDLSFIVNGLTTGTEALRIVASNGNVGVGSLTPGAKLEVDASASAIGVIVKANATTPGNLQEWQNSGGTILSSISSAGVPTFAGLLAANTTVNVSSDVTLTNKAVHFVSTAAARSLTLPAPSTNLFIVVKDSTGSAVANNITINPASGVIDGAATAVIVLAYGKVTIVSNGTDYYTI